MPDSARSPDIDALRRENAELRRALNTFQEAERRAAERRKRVAKTAGSFILPLMDRKRVVRSFMELVETTAGFTGPKDTWPTRDEVVEKSRLFALAFMRFVVRRRILVFMFSLLALSMPILQVYVAIQQNRIIENQNKYFNIQVYDTVARSITSGDVTSKQITAALLAREDFTLLNGIIYQVFSSDTGGAFTAQDASQGVGSVLRDAAARGHLIAALVQAIDHQATRVSTRELWTQVLPTFSFVLQDAVFRVPQILRFERESSDVQVTQETYRYLFNMGVLLRKVWSLAVSTGNERDFFTYTGPFIGRVSQVRMRTQGEQPFLTVFATAMQEFVIDLALEPKLGAAAPDLSRDPQRVAGLLKQGFERLRKEAGGAAAINWEALRRMVEAP